MTREEVRAKWSARRAEGDPDFEGEELS